MSVGRFIAVVDRMAELHAEQDAADAEDTAESALELDSLRHERRELEARLGDRLKGGGRIRRLCVMRGTAGGSVVLEHFDGFVPIFDLNKLKRLSGIIRCTSARHF